MYQFRMKIIDRPVNKDEKGYIALMKLGIFKDSEENDFVNLLNIYIESVDQIKDLENNEQFIRRENVEEFIDRSGSIAESIDNFYEVVDVDNEKNDEILSKVYEFRVRHSLWSAFRGQDIPDIYIGPIEDGHEISCVEKKFGHWHYVIDINTFFSEMKRIRQDLESSPI